MKKGLPLVFVSLIILTQTSFICAEIPIVPKHLISDKGICVVLEDSSCKKTLELAKTTGLLIYCQMKDQKDIDKASKLLDKQGLYGTRVFLAKGSLDRLHLADNIAECRVNMLEILAEYLTLDASQDLYQAASRVLSQNLIHGDALTMQTAEGEPITFAEWGYLGKGRFQRRDFRFDVLTGSSAFSAEGSLFAHLSKHEIFTPVKTYPPMAVSELAREARDDTPKETA